MSTEETYICVHKDEHIEVEMTGRTAKKTIPAIGGKPARDDILVEITPVNMEDGRWKKFLRKTELLTIEGE